MLTINIANICRAKDVSEGVSWLKYACIITIIALAIDRASDGSHDFLKIVAKLLHSKLKEVFVQVDKLRFLYNSFSILVVFLRGVLVVFICEKLSLVISRNLVTGLLVKEYRFLIGYDGIQSKQWLWQWQHLNCRPCRGLWQKWG